jgi:hypothetical protein
MIPVFILCIVSISMNEHQLSVPHERRIESVCIYADRVSLGDSQFSNGPDLTLYMMMMSLGLRSWCV